MAEKQYTSPTTKSAIALSVGVIGLATWFFSFSRISEVTYLAFIVSGSLLGMCLYRISDITEMAFTKGASVKLQKAEELGDGVAILAEQMLTLFEYVDVGSEPWTKEQEAAHEKKMRDTIERIRSLTKH